MRTVARKGLVQSYMPDLKTTECLKILNRLLPLKTTTKSFRVSATKGSPKCLGSVLQALSGEEDFSKFMDLKEKFDDEQREKIVMQREGYHHEKASHWTPKLFKDLKPQAPGVYLNFQPSMKQFAGYYKKPKGSKVKGPAKHSTARVYGEKWSQEEALGLVLRQLWSWHKKYGCESCL